MDNSLCRDRKTLSFVRDEVVLDYARTRFHPFYVCQQAITPFLWEICQAFLGAVHLFSI